MTPEELSAQLRSQDGVPDDLARRRAVVGISFAGVVALGIVALYQTGVLRSLPDPPIPYVDSDRVDASAQSYRYLATPDGTLGAISYAMTMALAAAGPPDRARTRPLVALAFGAKTAFDALNATALTAISIRTIGALCSYCTFVNAASLASFAFALPETRAAWRTLRGKATG